MLKSFLISRPYAIFDANNEQHRKAYFEYMSKGSWAECPYQFVLEEPYLDLPSCINYKMVEHYMQQEFTKKKTKTKVLVK